MQVVTRIIKWFDHAKTNDPPYEKCNGPANRHGICLYGLLDIPWLTTMPHFFANKFDDDADDLALQCLEIILRRREEREFCQDLVQNI